MSYDPLHDIESGAGDGYDPLHDIEHGQESPTSMPATTKPASVADIQIPKKRNIGWEMEESRLNDLAGMGEGLASFVSGWPAAIAAGYSGLKGLTSYFSGNQHPGQEAQNAIERTSQALTYEPKSLEGKLVARGIGAAQNAIMAVPEAANRKISEWTGSPALGASFGTAGAMLMPKVMGKGLGLAAERLTPLEQVPAETLQNLKVQPGDVPVPENLAAVEHSVLSGSPTQLPTAAQVNAGVVPGVTAPPMQFDPAFSQARHAEAFSEDAPTATNNLHLPQEEQQRRIRVLAEIGLKDPEKLRQSAITGDPLAAGTDAQIAKLDNDAGRHMTSVFKTEKAGLNSYAEDTVRQTGGHMDSEPGGTQTDNIIRGKSVPRVLDKFDNKLETQNKALYKSADALAEGRPLPKMDNLSGILQDESQFHNFEGGDRLLTALKGKMRNLQLIDKDGNMMPGTVRNSEALRQFVGSGDGAYPLRAKIRDAIDEDVFSQSGEDIYQQARALYKLRKDTLENPKGINSIMASEGPNGINRKTPHENIMGRLETMDPDQLGHVMNVLRDIKANHPELANDAQTAISNVQAHFAARAQQNGGLLQGDQWNSRGHNTFLRNNSEALNIVFQDKPELLHRMYIANEGGKILKYDAAYPGASAQANNLIKSGTLPNLVHKGSTLGGAAVGGYLGFPTIGTILGENLGSKAAAGMKEDAGLQAAKKRTTLVQKPTTP